MTLSRKIIVFKPTLQTTNKFFSNINVIPFKIVPLGSYTPMETLFPLLVEALEVFSRYGLQHVRYTRDLVFCKDILGTIRKRVFRVRPDIADKWMPDHDNAPCHIALSVTNFLTSKGIPVVPQPSYLPDLSPCDFFLSPKLKTVLKGRHFGTLENIQKSVTDMLENILDDKNGNSAFIGV